jgi:quercetin dioxygenase-like cupin family protein
MTERKSFDSTVLLRSEDSGGVVTVREHRVPPGWDGPPLHRGDFDEAFYVLEGELAFQLDDQLVRAGSGALAFAAAGVHRTLANLSDAEARYLLVRTPGAPAPSEVTPTGPTIRERSDLGPARPLDAVPGRVKVLVRGGESAGRVAVMDNMSSAGFAGPPLHHHAFDEAFYVLEGELTFQLGDELVTRGPGELAFAARGVHHTFANLSDAEARTLLICTPAGFERYFQRMAAREAGVDPPPEALEPWPEVTVVGPRIGES